MSAFHHSKQWKAARLAAKRRDGWKCVECGSRHRLEVDHVQTRAERPDLAFDLDNLRTLCRACHIAKTRAERAGPRSPERDAWRDLVDALMPKPKARMG
ncbi:MAG: HNH endonuclease [Pseudomonadota bacterium]